MSGGPGFWYSGLIGSSLLKDAGATPLGCTDAFSSITIKSEAPDCRAELTAALHPLIKNLDALNRNGAGLTHTLNRSSSSGNTAETQGMVGLIILLHASSFGAVCVHGRFRMGT